MHAILAAGPTESTARSDDASAVEERNAERSSGGDVAKEPFFQQVGQSWVCSQMEDELDERHAMDWLVGDEVLRQCGEVSKGEREDGGEEE